MLNVSVNNFQSCWDGATASWVLPVLFFLSFFFFGGGGGVNMSDSEDTNRIIRDPAYPNARIASTCLSEN